MRQNWLCGVILVFNACGSISDPQVAPPGTIQTAQRLTLGFSAGYSDSSTLSVDMCLTDNGVCVTAVKLTQEDCHEYSGAEFTLDGAPIKQVASGGYDDSGCTYPMFKADIPSQQLTLSGPHHLNLRIQGESVFLEIPDAFKKPHITSTVDKLVLGTDVSVLVNPKPGLIGEESLTFDYYLPGLDDQWCFAKYGFHGYNADLAKVHQDAWNDQGFSFHVPTNMPDGLGRLGIGTSFVANLIPCPFLECRIFMGHSVKIDNIEVMQP